MTVRGILILALLVADGASLFAFYEYLREGGRGIALSVGLVALYVFLAILVGMWAIRVAGGLGLARAARDLARQGTPDDGLLNAMLGLIGGALIMFPGLVSDALGLALIVPPTRTIARAWLRRRVGARSHRRPPGPGPAPPAGAPPATPPPGGPVEVRDYKVE